MPTQYLFLIEMVLCVGFGFAIFFFVSLFGFVNVLVFGLISLCLDLLIGFAFSMPWDGLCFLCCKF